MRSRERIAAALQHRESDRVPLDVGASMVTGMHVSTVYALRQALKLDPPGAPVKVIELRQMLGQVAPDLLQALGVDVAGVISIKNSFGFKNQDWKPWTFCDGTPILVPGKFNTEPDAKGDILMYPEGDRSVPPSARMPRGGFFFDTITRQPAIVEDKLDPRDNLEEFGPISNEELEHFRSEVERIYIETDLGILASFGGTNFGDIAWVPGLQLKHPRGIRGEKEWYMSLVMRPSYIYKVFDRQCDMALANLEKIYRTVGNRVNAVMVSGTDFGMQNGPIVSNVTYRKLFQPFHKRVNEWVHEHTSWKTFIHSCGSVEALINDFIEAGFDILNPVQTSAAKMEPRALKQKYGQKLVFWGGGVDTQLTLPFGTPEQVKREVRERIRVLGPNGGFVFNTIHNVQPRVPVQNVLALFEAFRDYSMYPIT